MDLLNCKVTHKTFGEGVVIAQNDNRITVKFATMERLFVVPESFYGFLRCKDEELQQVLETAYLNEKVEKEKKEQENRENRKKAIEEKFLKEAKQPKSIGPADENNLAFKCNFCDGGASSDCVGFKGLCSHENIFHNIDKNRAWCAHTTDSLCYKYRNGQITRAELESLYQTQPICYESKMLIDWKAEAGEDRNGVRGARARRIANVSKDCLAVLTTELPGMENGSDRVIFGVFITGVVDEGDEFQAGFVQVKENYYIELTPEECKKMKFWHYYKNAQNPSVVQWGTGLYRYMKDGACARILQDIVEIKQDPQQKAHAEKVLKEYCRIKGLDLNKIPQANGAF